MIWRLVRRDPAWKLAQYATIAAAIASPLVVKSSEASLRPADRLTVLFLFYGFMSMMSQQAQVRASRFEAGLPIDAHHLFAGRLIALAATIWPPAITAFLSILAFCRPAPNTATAPLQVAAISTCFLLGLQSFRVRELEGPRWLLALFYGPFWALAWTASWTGLLPAAALTCAVVGAVLFARTWRLLPASFELAAAHGIAPSEVEWGSSNLPDTSAGTVTSSGGRSFPWWPVLHSVFSLQYWLFLPQFLLVQLGRGGQWLNTLFFLVLLWFITRQRLRWLSSLPLRPAAVLSFVLGPIFLLMALGYLIEVRTGNHRRHYPDARYFLVDLGLIFGANLLIVLLCAVADWRRLRFIPAKARMIAVCLLVFVSLCLLGILPSQSTWREAQIFNAVQWIVNAVPDNPAVVLAVILLVLAAIYAATAKVAGESEYGEQAQNAYWEADSWFSRRK